MAMREGPNGPAVARPEERWGSLLPSQGGDEELYLHVVQHVHTAGGEPPRREGTQLGLDTPPMPRVHSGWRSE